MTDRADIHEGSCCCGRVRYRIVGRLETFSHCHCTDCRKSHGAAFATYIGARWREFTLLQGGDDLGGYTTATGTRRGFCRNCGSSLTCTVTAEPEAIYVAAATFDTPLNRKPEYHIFVRSKVPWIDIADGLPQHREFGG